MSVSRLFTLFSDILLLRKGPQDVPVSSTLLGALVILNLLAGSLLFTTPEQGGSDSMQALADIGLSLVMYAAVVYLRGFPERVLQTLTAFTGTGLLLTLVLFPITIMLGQESQGMILTAGRLMFMGLLIWSLAVDGHIFRHSLNINMMAGAAVAILVFVVRIYILETLWPG